MLQHVDIVLIGKNIPASYTTADALAVGDVALFDQNRAILKTAAKAANATSLYVGVAQNKVNVTMPDGSVAQKANIKFGNESRKIQNLVLLLVNMLLLFRIKLLLP